MLHLTEEREKKIRYAASCRQPDLTVLLENVHDPHNIGAVLRTCDCVGIGEIYVLYTEASKNAREKYIGINSSSGSRKWVRVHFYEDTESCIAAIKCKYRHLLGTHLNTESKSLYELDLTGSVALVFGNEHTGLSDNILKHLDGNFIIPQYGMVQSLNISVACAVTLFEASRQRMISGKYSNGFDPENPVHREYYMEFLKGHNPRAFPTDDNLRHSY